jgi:hypothetical protein
MVSDRTRAAWLQGCADVAQLVEHHLAKVRVAGSNPVVRSERVSPSPCGEQVPRWSGREARQRTANPCTRVQIPSPPRAIGAVGARFPDTEEVTGSNPVSPTSITPGQSQIPGSQTVPGAGPETVAYLTAYLSPRLLMREEGVHRASTAGEHRPQLLAVDQLGDTAARVANQVGDVLDTHPGAR